MSALRISGAIGVTRPAILVHGGAGALASDDLPDASREGCLLAARAGHRVLAEGGSALDAVTAAVVILEDDSLFNAGTGACLNAAGEVELDASVMDGRTLAAGAVAAVRDVKNPVVLARAVMEHTPHVMLAGVGASQLAAELGIPRCSPEALVTPRARALWEKARARAVAATHGTVGAVAIDRDGHVAAATSTGGAVNKRVGRIGDSPLIGAGTYASDASGAVSMTGAGEAIIRIVAAKLACDLLRQGVGAEAVTCATLKELEGAGGEGGIILVAPNGAMAFAFNTARMARAWRDGVGNEGAGFGPSM